MEVLVFLDDSGKGKERKPQPSLPTTLHTSSSRERGGCPAHEDSGRQRGKRRMELQLLTPKRAEPRTGTSRETWRQKADSGIQTAGRRYDCLRAESLHWGAKDDS